MLQGCASSLDPGVAAVVDEGMDVVKHTVGEPIVADELPDDFSPF